MNVTRRDFFSSCAAYLAAAAALAPAARLRAWAGTPLGRVVAREPFGYMEQISDGIWALVSTPLQGERATLCNGGIIAGRSAVLAIEGFFEPRGAAWLAGRARELTGRWPTHVAVTHFHPDHANGVAGYQSADQSAELRATAITRDLVRERNKAAAPQSDAWEQAIVIPAGAPSTLDLGGRTARIVPRHGHTKSDVSIEVSDPQVIFCGDLVWNAMFPNYVDAAPAALARSVRNLRGAAPAVYVPGHGALAGASELDRYIAVLDEVERAARRAHGQGLTAAEAGARFALPASLGEWALFNPAFFERAFSAWYRELQ